MSTVGGNDTNLGGVGTPRSSRGLARPPALQPDCGLKGLME